MSVRHKLLAALDERGSDGVSGAALARDLGITRMGIWKHVKALQNLGFPIQGRHRAGYRLVGPSDCSLTGLSSALLPHGVVPHYFFSTASTQVLAKAGAMAGLPEGHLWLAETQSAGRGRLGRRWESPWGGLWFSLLLRPALAPGRVPPLALVAGLSLLESMCRWSDAPLAFKWPNDLLMRRNGSWKKCAGILTEMSGEAQRTDWVVIGIGVNIYNALAPSLRRRAAALAPRGRAFTRRALLEDFLRIFHRHYRRFKRQGFAPFRNAYWAHYSRPNEPVRLRTGEGSLHGVARGVDAFGALIVESRRKTRHFSEGEIIA